MNTGLDTWFVKLIWCAVLHFGLEGAVRAQTPVGSIEGNVVDAQDFFWITGNSIRS